MPKVSKATQYLSGFPLPFLGAGGVLPTPTRPTNASHLTSKTKTGCTSAKIL